MAPFDQSTAAQWHDTAADENEYDVNTTLPISPGVSAANHEVERALAKRRLADSHLMDNSAAHGSSVSPLHEWNTEAESLIVDLPPRVTRRRRGATLHALQEWEGYVAEIRHDDVVARLTDITAGHRYESVEAIIPRSEIAERDAERMVEGSIFRWVIGIERSGKETVSRVSRIVFRDLPRMTQEDYRRGREWARSTMANWT